MNEQQQKSWVFSLIEGIPSKLVVLLPLVLGFCNYWSLNSFSNSQNHHLNRSVAAISCVIPNETPIIIPVSYQSRQMAEQNIFAIAEVMRAQDSQNWNEHINLFLTTHKRPLNSDFGPSFCSDMSTVFQNIHKRSNSELVFTSKSNTVELSQNF